MDFNVALGVGGVLLTTLAWFSWRKKRKARPGSQHVLIIGGSKGIGKAFVEAFEKQGDFVVATSRTATDKLVACDVASAASVSAAFEEAREKLGGVIDIVINMAAITQQSRSALCDISAEEMKLIADTNVLGTLNVAREAGRVLPRGAHLVLVGGAGTRRAMSTPQFATYGFTKAGLTQLMRTLSSEYKDKGIGVHLIVPGMAFTDLLNAEKKPREVRRIFNILAEPPAVMAAYFVPKLRSLGLESQQYDYLTPSSVVWRFFLSFLGLKKNKYVDEESGKMKEF